ncbi:MAG: hypothetical protein ACYST6_06350 [Planctomycetota bacterium]|jgi:hypothetical protein
MKYASYIVCGAILVTIVTFSGRERLLGESVMLTADVAFDGKASGGTLVLTRTRNRNQGYVVIETSPGEAGESVARRLADAINTEDPFQWNVLLTEGEPMQVAAQGNRISGLPGPTANYALGGTERGLSIPEPPLFLSCRYDERADEINLKWVNPPSGYDSIIVTCYGRGFDQIVLRERLAGDVQSYTIQHTTNLTNEMAARVAGYCKGMSSNQAAIQMHGYRQQETYGIPFARGVAPNWAGWTTAASGGADAFEQGDKFPKSFRYADASTLLTKPFYQVIKAPGAGAANGVWRKFLGLTGGHTYRIAGCINTLQMGSVKGDWSASFHAAYNPPDGKNLTPKQLAAVLVLPSGEKASEAGAIVSYKQGNSTNGSWKLVFTGEKTLKGVQTPHVTLPADVDTLTVWVRFNCADPNGKIAFSGVSLEDITAEPNVKRPHEVRIEEREEEEFLLACRSKVKRAGLLK